MNILPETLKASLAKLNDTAAALAAAQAEYDNLLLSFARQELGKPADQPFIVVAGTQSIQPYKAELLGNRIRLTGFVIGKDGQVTGLRRSTLTEIKVD